MLPASRYLLLGSSWSGCAFFSSPQWCYFPRTCLLSLGLFGAPQSFRKEILVKKYLLWIIQWPLALVLRAIMKSWSVPLLSMQLLILDTPIISLFSLVLNKSHFFFSVGNLSLLSILCIQTVSYHPVPYIFQVCCSCFFEMKGSDP